MDNVEFWGTVWTPSLSALDFFGKAICDLPYKLYLAYVDKMVQIKLSSRMLFQMLAPFKWRHRDCCLVLILSTFNFRNLRFIIWTLDKQIMLPISKHNLQSSSSKIPHSTTAKAFSMFLRVAIFTSTKNCVRLQWFDMEFDGEILLHLQYYFPAR